MTVEGVVSVPRHVTEISERSAVVIPKVVVPVTRVHPEVDEKVPSSIDYDARDVTVAGRAIDRRAVVHRREKLSAIAVVVVPITVTIDPSVGRRYVPRRHPDPTNLMLSPVSGAPHI